MSTTAPAPGHEGRERRIKRSEGEVWGPFARRALPVFPQTLFQVNAVLSSSPVNVGRLITVIGDDPAMAVNLLREANASDPDVPCDHMLDAVMGVGLRKLQAMLLRTPVMTGPEANSEPYRLWRTHSVLAAVLAETVARTCGVPVASQARLAGLVHDIGKLPLLVHGHLESGAEPLLSDAANEWSEVLNHCQLGKLLAEEWGLSPVLRSVITDHHSDQAVAPGALAIVIAADRLCHRCGATLDENMARVYGSQSLGEIIEGALPWLTRAQRQQLAVDVRRSYDNWRRTHPGVLLTDL